jgi:hypothetical protein
MSIQNPRISCMFAGLTGLLPGALPREIMSRTREETAFLTTINAHAYSWPSLAISPLASAKTRIGATKD